MVSSVTGAPQIQPAAQPAPVEPKPVQVKPKAAVMDTVNVSAAAKAASTAAKAALQEATETPAQTAKEAQSGDRLAQRLLAKEKAENSK
ncbi:MAG: hypothetical protein ABSG48_04100 [Geobacteraceae bacterium]|jgi:hypothetical protein